MNNPDNNVAFNDRLGRCYELAGRVALHNEEALLIHGSIQWQVRKPDGGENKRINHAWVEWDGGIWEPTGNSQFDRAVFHALFEPITEEIYSHAQLTVLLLKHRHWGPWS